jgi:RNA polymerase sigma-70 factor (ECF subfamily)
MENSNTINSSEASVNMTENNSAEEVKSADELLNEYISGNTSAFEKMFELIGAKLFSFICRYTLNPHRAEDIYQDVCIKVACKAGEFSGGNASAWIFRIARNACIDVIRYEARRPAVSLDREIEAGRQVEGKSEEPSEDVAKEELLRLIMSAVEKLPDEQREVFLLKEEGGLTFAEIADIVGCGRETAKSRMRYALERLRNALGREASNYGL